MHIETGLKVIDTDGWSLRRSSWVSEQFLNGTSAQLGCTVPFTSVHARKYVTEDKSRTDTSTLQQLNTTQKKQTTRNTSKQNQPGLMPDYDTRPVNKVGLCYNAPEPTRGRIFVARHPSYRIIFILLTCDDWCRGRMPFTSRPTSTQVSM